MDFKKKSQSYDVMRKSDNQESSVKLSSNKTIFLVTLCILATEMCERLTYYSISAGLVLYCTSNLDIVETDAITINQIFGGFAMIVPILGGFIADSHAGRFKTIFGSSIVYIVGVIFLPASAINYSTWGWESLTTHGRTGLFITGLVLVALGTGGIKANVGPFGAEQVEVLGKDAIQSFFNWFYWVINVGALIAFAGVAYIQQNISFVWGFFVPLASMILAITIFVAVHSKYSMTQPKGSILTPAWGICLQGSCRSNPQKNPKLPEGSEKKTFARAKSSFGGRFQDHLVDGVVSVLRVTPFCLLVVMYWAIYAQMSNTFFAQSERMDTRLGSDGYVPAAALNVFNTVSIIILIPFVDRIIYPCFERLGKPLTYLKRIGIGMLLSVMAVVVAGIVEIYRKKDLEMHSHIQVLGGENFTASSMSVFVQIPQFALIGASEIFTSITTLEFAYNQAPVAMQGLLTGLFLASSGIGNWVSTAILIIVQKATAELQQQRTNTKMALPGSDLDSDEFPCAFNLIRTQKLTLTKLRTVERNLAVELDHGEDCESDLIRKKNMLSWIYFRLEMLEQSVELSDEIHELTGGRNIVALANRCFIMWKSGDELTVKTCNNCLKSLKNDKNFHKLLTEAKAEQAYFYSRLGGPDNLWQAEKLFSEVVEEVPTNYLWKYGLGLVSRRATHGNIFCSSSKNRNLDELNKKAIQCLFDVADNGDSRLRSMAYAELLAIRGAYIVGERPDYDALFRQLSIDNLIDKALENSGITIPAVLTKCGKALCWTKFDKSIELLEISVKIKPSSTSYHYLGRSFKRKAQIQALNNNRQRASSGGVETDGPEQCTEVRAATADSSLTETNTPKGTSDLRGVRRQLFNQPVDRRHIYPANSFPSRRSAPSANATFRGYGRNRPNDLLRGRGQSLSAPQFNLDSCNYGQYEQVFPLEQRKQTGFYEHRARSHCMRPGNSYSRSFSTPPTATEANRRFQRARGNSQFRGRVHEHGNSLTEQEIIASSRKPSNQVYLSVEDEFVKKAVDCFKQAIKLSSENFPAILDLGIMLKETGEVEEPLKYFNSVTNSHLSSRSHRVSVISAYEQAGLCYLELKKKSPTNSGFEEDGKRKLTQAVSLAAELTLTMPELQGKVHNLWTALEKLMNALDGEQSSPHYFKEKVKLLELAKNYHTIIDIFQNIPALTGEELGDKDIVTAALNSYLKLAQYENAIALQNIIALRPEVRKSMWWKTNPVLHLRISVLLQAISARLTTHERKSENPVSLFQQVFQIVFGTCFGARDCDENDQSAGDFVGDVLVVFNDDEEVDKSPDSSTVSSLCLQQVVTGLFGLETSRNLQGPGNAWGVQQHEAQLREMRKYQVVIIVLGSEPRYPNFDVMLKSAVNTNHQRILILDAGLKDGQMPCCLQDSPSFKLQNISGINPSLNCETQEAQISYNDILTQGFHGDVDGVMQLFCFITGQKWPRSGKV